MTGDTKTEAEGKAEKAAGKVQNTVGGVKELVARKVNRLNFTWTLTPGLGRGFSFLYRK